jgi:hypothetical protein
LGQTAAVTADVSQSEAGAEALALKDFRRIPGVGKSIARDLWQLGLRRVDDLREADPELLYEQFCVLQGAPVDRCLLYVFREAVYFASHEQHDPELLKWWNWKDR